MARSATFRVTVIAGTLKGRRLRYPDTPGVRPTMQRAKSSIFESLRDRIRGAVFVDLFSGAGAMGIEALSRGAGFVHFVEMKRTCLTFLRRNLEDCGIPENRYGVHPGAVERVLGSGALAGAAADIVHIDPPYADTDFSVLLELLGEIGYSESGLVVLEHPRQMVLEDRLTIIKTRRFGQTAVSFFDASEVV